MVDYVSVLKKTIDNLPKNTPEIRQRIYDKARQTVEAKLDMIKPAPSQALRDRQLAALDDAVRLLEAEYGQAMPAPVAPPALQPAPPSPPPLPEPSYSPPPAPERAPPPAVQIDEPTDAEFEPLESAPAPAMAEPPPAPVEPRRETPALPRTDDPLADWMDEIEAPSPVTSAAPASRDDLDFVDDLVSKGADAANRLDEVVVPPVRRAAAPRTGLIAAVVGLVILGTAGWFAWMERDRITALFAGEDTIVAEPVVTPDEPAQPAAPVEPAAPAEDTTKFTQRLTPEGTEVAGNTPAPAGAEQSVAQLQPGSQQPAPQAPAPASPATAPETAPAAEQPIAVGEQAIFYEERTTAEQGTAIPGAVVWRLVEESPGNDLPPEPAVRGEVSIPEKQVNVRMTLRRNADPSLPASHIIEIVVDAPEGFAGGGIEEIQRVNLKADEASPGQSLAAVPVKIADGFFLVALDADASVREINEALLRDQQWLDMPVVYRTGRRALFTLEKGTSGDAVFRQAFAAWDAAR